MEYRLEVPKGDSAFLSLRSNGDLALFFLPVPWNPDTYVLTDPAGTRYMYDANSTASATPPRPPALSRRRQDVSASPAASGMRTPALDLSTAG